MRIVLISDNPLGFSGGAEINDKILQEELQCEFVTTAVFNQTLSRFNDVDLFILSNHYDIDQDAVDFLYDRKFIHIAHDFLFCNTRRPDFWSDCIVPDRYLRNKELFKKASVIVTHSTLQTEIFKKNVEANYYNLKGNLWSEYQLDLLASNSRDEKVKKAFVIESPNPVKGTSASEKFCQQYKIPYEKFGPMGYDKFIEELGYYSLYVGFSELESFGRVHCEAAMMGVIPIGNDNIGFLSDYDGDSDELYFTMEKKKEELVNLIKSYL